MNIRLSRVLNPTREGKVRRASDLSSDEFEEWDRLLVSGSANFSPFLSPHFTRAVAESGVDVRVCVIHEEGEIVAFFPYQYVNDWSRRFGSAQRVGGELNDSCGIVADAGFRISAPELLQMARLSHFNFSHLDEAQLAYGLLAEQPRLGLRAKLNPEAVPVLSSVGSVTRHYTKDTAKRERKLVSELGPANFQFNVETDREQMLHRLIEQKRAQYSAGGVADSLGEQWKRDALSKIAQFRHGTCTGVLSSLFAGETWIASHFGMMGNGTFHLWFPVYNPEQSKYSPGRLLLHSIIESCQEQGFNTIDRGEGDTPRKREIANEEYRLFRGEWRNNSCMGLLASGVERVRWRIGL